MLGGRTLPCVLGFGKHLVNRVAVANAKRCWVLAPLPECCLVLRSRVLCTPSRRTDAIRHGVKVPCGPHVVLSTQVENH